MKQFVTILLFVMLFLPIQLLGQNQSYRIKNIHNSNTIIVKRNEKPIKLSEKSIIYADDEIVNLNNATKVTFDKHKPFTRGDFKKGARRISDLPVKYGKGLEVRGHKGGVVLEPLEPHMMKRTKNMEEKRLALIIANYEYTDSSHFASLHTPDQDAEDISIVLNELGFDTYLAHNVTSEELVYVVDSVLKKDFENHKYNIGLVYYTGHGMQNGNNIDYIVPIDGKKNVAFQKLISGFKKNEKWLFFFDACRTQLDEKKLKEFQKELPQEDQNTVYDWNKGDRIIMFSGEAKKSVQDSVPRERNSPFVKVLLKSILKENIDAYKVLKGLGSKLETTLPVLEDCSFDFKFNPSSKYIGLEGSCMFSSLQCFGGNIYIGFPIKRFLFVEFGAGLYSVEAKDLCINNFIFNYKIKVDVFGRLGYVIYDWPIKSLNIEPYCEASYAYYVSSKDRGSAGALYPSFNTRVSYPITTRINAYISPGIAVSPPQRLSGGNFKTLGSQISNEKFFFKISGGVTINY